MSDLRQQLEALFDGRVGLVGVGNPDYGDDGFGVYLAQKLAASEVPNVVIARNALERSVGRLAEEAYDTVIFLDAVECGAAPGSVVLLNADEMSTRFPQLSTHKISLGLLSRWIESNGITKAWLLGVQPASLTAEARLSPTMQSTLDALAELLCEISAAKQGSLSMRTRRTEEAQV